MNINPKDLIKIEKELLVDIKEFAGALKDESTSINNVSYILEKLNPQIERLNTIHKMRVSIEKEIEDYQSYSRGR